MSFSICVVLQHGKCYSLHNSSLFSVVIILFNLSYMYFRKFLEKNLNNVCNGGVRHLSKNNVLLTEQNKNLPFWVFLLYTLHLHRNYSFFMLLSMWHLYYLTSHSTVSVRKIRISFFCQNHAQNYSHNVSYFEWH